MRISMTQHSVGQGGFFTGVIKHSDHIDVSYNNDNIVARRNTCESQKDDDKFKFVYDCGSKKYKDLKKEIDRTFEKDDYIDMLFVSHFDEDHVNGIKHLLKRCHVETVVLPYLSDYEKIVLTARSTVDIDKYSAYTKFNAKMIWKAEELLQETGNGVSRLILIGHDHNDETDSESDSLGESGEFRDTFEEVDIDGERWQGRTPYRIRSIRARAADASRPRKIHTINVSSSQIRKMIFHTETDKKKKHFLLIPYVHSPCGICFKDFAFQLKNYIHKYHTNKYKKQKSTINYGNFIISELGNDCFRMKLKEIYDTICPDHNLISMTLYAGPHDLNTRFLLSGRSITQCTRSGGFLLTGDANFSDRENLVVGKCSRCNVGVSDNRRRNKFLDNYKECVDLVGAFMAPHHGSNYNFDLSVISPFENLVTCYAAVGDNDYDHPGFAVRDQISRKSSAHFETVESISSLCLSIVSIETHIDLIKRLQDLYGNSPTTLLHHAAKYGRLLRIRTLITAKANINAKDAYRMTPLHYATMSKNLDCMQALVEEGASINSKDIYDRTPLHYAATLDNEAGIKILKGSETNIWININDCYHRIPLHYAAMSGKYMNIRELISKNNRLNAQDEYGCTPLHYAAALRTRCCVIALVDAGAKVEIGNKDMKTPLHIAAEFGSPLNIFILVESGANVNAKDIHDRAPIHYAAMSKSYRSIGTLIGVGGNENCQDVCGFTPLHYAVESESVSNVATLIGCGADPNIEDRCYRSPLYLAFLGRQIDIITKLVRNGADYHGDYHKDDIDILLSDFCAFNKIKFIFAVNA